MHKTVAHSLRVAVNRLIGENQARYGIDIEFCEDLGTGELLPELLSAIMSIIQELLLNACRHSKSKRVLLGLAQDDGYLCVQVEDWGVGFDPENAELHQRRLKGIRDLVGWLHGTVEIDSHCGVGTCVMVEVPLSQETEPIDLISVRRPMWRS